MHTHISTYRAYYPLPSLPVRLSASRIPTTPTSPCCQSFPPSPKYPHLAHLWHDITQHIETTGPPVSARPRRLAQDCFKAAKREFDHRLQLRIIRPSSSAWYSPLHMVSKRTPSYWRPCGDYHALNHKTVPDHYPVTYS